MTLRVLATLLLATTSLHAQAPAPATVVTGRVVAEATGQPVRRAYVIVHGPGTRTTRVTMSGLEGEFRFEGLPADRYRVGASKRPHLSAAVDATGADVVIALPAGGVVTGGVVGDLGHPAGGVAVTISGTSLPVAQTVTTNQLGEYRFFGIPPGDYTIGPVIRRGETRTVTVARAGQHQVATLALQSAEAPEIPGRPPVATGTGVISGIALDAASQEPLAGATVTGRSTGRSAVTDANGRFLLEGLGVSTYSLLVQGGGFLPMSMAQVVLREDARVDDVVLHGSRAGSITGTVRDEVGDPVVGMPVSTYRSQVLNYQTVLAPRGTGLTDDRGMYDIRDLPPGDYLLCACAETGFTIDPLLLRQLGATAPDAATVSRLIGDTVHTFAPAYFPGLARASDSRLLRVESGDVRLGMDITMYGVRPFSVSGRLVDANGAPATQMQAYLTTDGDLPGAIGLSGTKPMWVGVDGRFQFLGVTPGKYFLNAIPTTPGNRTPWASTAVTVADRNVEDLVVTVGNGVTVKGRVEFSGPAARPTDEVLEKVRVSLNPIDISMGMFTSMGNAGTIGHGTTLDANGVFSVDGLAPGRFLVSAGVPGSPWHTERLAAVGAATLDNVVTIEAGAEVDLLIVMSYAPPAMLTGTVSIARERYEAPGSVRMVIFPSDPARWLVPERYPGQFKWSGASAEGVFRFIDMAPGDYYVHRGTTFDSEMSLQSFERWARTAQRVTLRAGETTTINIK